jgi:hypothetical protein
VNLRSPENLGAPRPPKIESEECDGRDDFHHDSIIVLLPLVSSFFVENINPVLDEFTLEEMAPSHRCLVVNQCLGHGRVVTGRTGGGVGSEALDAIK